MKRGKRVLILVDFKFRDLPGLALVKYHLESKYNHEVFLVPNIPPFDDKIFTPLYKPHLVVYSYFAYPRQIARARALKKNGISLAVISAEGMSTYGYNQEQLAGKYINLLGPVDLYFVWNQTIAQLILEFGTLPPKRFFVTGVPRFDFYHPRFHKLYLSKEELCGKYGLNPNMPIVTWATNFGFTRTYKKEAEIADLIKRYKQQGLIDFPPFSDFPRYIKREVESREILGKRFCQLAQMFPDVNFVAKVHPAENPEDYRKLGEAYGLKNLAVVSKEYIWNILASTDVHLHRSCTTAIEAYFLNKPTIDLQEYPYEYFFSEEIASGGDVARSFEDLVTQVSYYLDGGAISSEKMRARERAIEWWCGKVDGKTSERHADIIHAFLEQSTSEPKIGWGWKDISVLAKAQLRKLLGLEYHHSLRAWLSGENPNQDNRGRIITSRDVDEWTSKIKGCYEA